MTGRKSHAAAAAVEPVMVSGAMKRLERALRSVADKDLVIGLHGERGTGKEVLARRLHDLSPWRALPFVCVHCATALPAALELVPDADATASPSGEPAAGATVYLDELGDASPALQLALLRLLERRRAASAGSDPSGEGAAPGVRVVYATSRPLHDDLARGALRADLFDRVQGVAIAVAPLRERRADVAPLLRQVLAQCAARHRVVAPRLTRAAAAALGSYAWPGNVRELCAVVERVCVLRAGRAVRLADLPLAVQSSFAQRTGRAVEPPSVETLVVRMDQPLDDTIDDILRRAVELEGGNRSRAAARLGIGLRTLQRRLGASL